MPRAADVDALHGSHDGASEDALTAFEVGLRDHFPSRDDILREARAQTARQRRKQHARAKATAVVLAIVAVVAVGVADPAWHTRSVQTAIGEQRAISLPDGSTIVLNTGSRLEIDMRLFSRRFTLVEGEAAFRVAHGWRPFVVTARRTTVRDIGTVFSVRNESDGARVAVQEGAVEVTAYGGRMALRAPDAMRTGAGLLSSPAPAEAGSAAWQQGRLVFDGTPLREVVVELQRYRRAPVQVMDERAARQRLSGRYDIQGIEGLLDALSTTLPVATARDPDGTVRIRSR